MQLKQLEAETLKKCHFVTVVQTNRKALLTKLLHYAECSATDMMCNCAICRRRRLYKHLQPFHYRSTDSAARTRTVSRAYSSIADYLRTAPVSHYRIAPKKVSPSRQFTGKNPPRRAAARARRILPVNCRPKETFLRGGGQSYNGETFIRLAIF